MILLVRSFGVGLLPMELSLKKFYSRLADIVRHPRTRKIAIWCVAIVVTLGIIVTVAPPLLRNKIAAALSDKLHRQVSIEEIWVNPLAMTATVRGFAMKERQSASTAVSFDELYVNLQLQSLFRLGPVIRELRLVKPYISLVRQEDLKYNFQDLIDEFTAGPKDPAAPTPRFALYNIEILDGKIDFDDRPEQTKHTISSLRIGVPFISSLPTHVDIQVKPAFSAVLDGAPLEILGDTHPFKDSLETNLQLDIKNLEVPKYLAYSPVELNFTVPSGVINGHLTASFRNFKDKAPTLDIAGNLALNELIVNERDNTPLISLPSLEVDIGDLKVFAAKATLTSVKAKGLELHLKQDRSGQLNVARMVNVPAAAPPAEPKKEAAPFIYQIDDFLLEGGKLYFVDETPAPPYRNTLTNLRLAAKSFTNEKEKKSDVELSFESESKERLNYSAVVQLDPLLVEGKFDLKGFRLGPLFPYYQNVLNLEVREGVLDVTGEHKLAAGEKELAISVGNLNAAFKALQLYLAGKADPLWRIPSLVIKDTNVDVNKKSIAIGAFESQGGKGSVEREADGTINYARLFKTKAAEEQPKTAEKETPWQVTARRINLERFGVVFDDKSVKNPTTLVASDFSWRIDNFSNAKGSRSNTTIQTRVNDKGTLRLTGSLGTLPPVGELKIEAKDVDLLPFQPYMIDRINFRLTSGRVGTTGDLTFDASGDGPVKAGYQGEIQITDFATVMKDNSEDLLKWKSLDLKDLKFALEPTQVSMDEIVLSEFYSRLILAADGKFNLQRLTGEKDEKKEKPDAQSGPPQKTPETASTPAAPEKQMRIGQITLQNGNINFSDFFIKPNYTANLTGVNGKISEVKADTPADLEIQAKLNNAAPVGIRGKINPLAKDLFLDVAANVDGIDLSPLSPYSGKYVGYGIEKGKLSFKVKYKVENRKLAADNQIILNQLTFGEKVESPDATSLPVLLAVALLKDRNGVIDIDLPISGSLDDPQFSVGGLVLKIIFNIISKAVTAPFALLGAMFGGGEELSYVEFDYGRAALTQAAEAKLKSLAAAMDNRPALKLEMAGRVDPVNDPEGLKKVSIERKVKAQKMKDLVRQGKAPKSVDDVRIEKDEYPRYLKAAYGEESFPKPRNVIGLAKDLPVPEMETLMLQHAKVGDDAVRELANNRAQVVKDYLLASGQVTQDRLFIVASKPGPPGEKDKAVAKLSRVDFSLK